MNLNIPLHSLSPKELEIMQYVHEHSVAIVSMSIQTFAQEINYSTSTVIRFCRKLGFSGFPEFKYFLKNLNIQKELYHPIYLLLRSRIRSKLILKVLQVF
jgi:RpiR family glv operon transcriptional regulator